MRELWQHRDLLFYLVLRDIRVLTSSTKLGMLWIFLQPLSVALVLIIVMGMFVKVPTGDVPYAVVVLSGFLSWNYLSGAINRASSSMIASSYLLTKVYFPRLIIPAVPVISGLIEFAALMLILFVAALHFGVAIRLTWLFVPAVASLAVALAVGVGLWFSALTIRFRDFSHAVPVILQIGTYASPVLYPVNLVPDRWRWLYELNPTVGVIELTRWALYGGAPFPASAVGISLLFSAALIASGVIFFRVTEDIAADIV
jgi:lipopolysaccharide transport system permease protein